MSETDDKSFTWAGLLSWAAANGVTPETVLEDEDGNPIVDLSFERAEEPDPEEPGDKGSGPVLILQKTYG